MTEIFTAKTVDEAKELAVRHFGAAPDDITFEVLEEPTKGFFGFGKKGEARVRATYISVNVSMDAAVPVEQAPAAEEKKPTDSIDVAVVNRPLPEEPAPVIETECSEAPAAEEVQEAPVEEEAPAAEEAPAEKTSEQLDVSLITGEPSASALAKIEKAKNYLTGILTQMGIEAELHVTAGAESAMIDIVAANNGAVIGKRGETLDALQYLTFMIANRGDKEYYRVILNSANYRERRRKTLEELAAKIARNVLRSGRQTSLEPMNPYERRIIHSAIAEIEGVSSKSVGEEPYRKVVISSLNKPPRRRRNDRNDRGDRQNRGNNRRNDRDNRNRRNPDAPPTRINMDSMKTSFEKDYKRPKPEDDLNAGLYGKIEF
ncbi:MAG: KH domain-containing protein [Ruminococcus sp.]|nr:KH domain-containing protein [Ruminococcus sp.]